MIYCRLLAMSPDGSDDGQRWFFRQPEWWTLLAVAIGGSAAAPFWLVAGGALALALLHFPGARWQGMLRRGQVLDAEWHELAALAWTAGQARRAIFLWARGHVRWLVLGAHVANNLFFCALAYLLGQFSAWLWF